jgi:hypothetical protein
MYLLYVDESGDPGLTASPTNFFVLSGIVVHELRWNNCLDQMIDFRRRMQRAFGLRVREEIHAAAMINNPGALQRIKRNDRLTILRFFADELASMPVSIINIGVDKSTKTSNYDPFVAAWRAMIQRFSNTMLHRNFRGPVNPDERGMIFPDHTDTKKLTQLMRQLRRLNPISRQPTFGLGYRNLPIVNIIEDPNFRESSHSHFIQAADLAAFVLYQKFASNAYIRSKSAQNYFDRLDPVLCKVASKTDPQGIVKL